MLIPIDNAILDRTVAQAGASPRSRMIHRYHEHSEPVQRMLNAIEQDSYIMPTSTKTPIKSKSFWPGEAAPWWRTSRKAAKSLTV